MAGSKLGSRIPTKSTLDNLNLRWAVELLESKQPHA